MSKLNVPIARLNFSASDAAALVEPLTTGWVVQGPNVAKFEKAITEQTSVEAVCVSSGTAALHVAVEAMKLNDLKPGDEVIVPGFTWCATANVVELCGAKAVFADVDPRTFNVDAEKVAAVVTERTAGVIVVHLFGRCAPVAEVMEAAQKKRDELAKDGRKLWCVEDAACALGTRFSDGSHVGSKSAYGTFSLHPRKSITTGEGGFVTTGDAKLGAVARALRNHGLSNEELLIGKEAAAAKQTEMMFPGFNYRMTDMQGALGVSQMTKLAAFLDERNSIAQRYDKELAGIASLVLPTYPDWAKSHTYQAYVCIYHEGGIEGFEALCAKLRKGEGDDDLKKAVEKRDALCSKLAAEGVSTRPGTQAMPLLLHYRKRVNLADTPYSVAVAKLSVALPIFPGLSNEEQAYVVAKVKELA